MKKRFYAVLLAGALSTAVLAGCGGATKSEASAPAADTAAAAAETADAAVDTAAAEAEDASADAAEGVSYVDGFYANDGNGNDFIIAFYEGSAGDVAYVSDGTNEVFAEYTVEAATADDGTEYLIVNVGEASLGYLEDGEDIYIIDDEGNIYVAGRLSEEEADTIYQTLQ